LRAKKIEIGNMQREYEKEMKLLDSVIAAKSGEEKLPLVSTFTAKAKDNYWLK